MAWWDEIDIGIKVERTIDPMVIVASPGDPFFTIAGGMVLLTGLIGIIDVAPGGAQTISFELNPDVVAGADTVLCTPTNITTATLEDIITISGDPTDALINGHLQSNLMFEDAPNGIALAPGVLGFVATAALGQAHWVIWYKPVDDGAVVTVVGP